MSAFTKITEKAAAFDRANVDTDQIIPKQFLKRIEKTGFGRFLFNDWRYSPDGEPNPHFELNRPENAGAKILIANENFGCGSSREHAPWALLDYGFKAIIAPSFADIFYQNSLKNGLLPVTLDAEKVAQLLQKAEHENYELTVDLENESIFDTSGFKAHFSIDPYWKKMLVNGWDEIEITMQLDEYITVYEKAQ